MLSKRQRQIYELITSFQATRGYSPTYRELQQILGLASVGTVQKHVQKIKAQGLLESNNTWRGLKTIATQNASGTPIIGTLSKSSGMELFAKVELYPTLVPDHQSDSYGFRIKDDSFHPEGFYRGDILIIATSFHPEEGSFVLMSSEGGLELCPFAKRPLSKKTKLHGTVELLIRSFLKPHLPVRKVS